MKYALLISLTLLSISFYGQPVWISPLANSNYILSTEVKILDRVDSTSWIVRKNQEIVSALVIQILNICPTTLHSGNRLLGNIGFGQFPEISGQSKVQFTTVNYRDNDSLILHNPAFQESSFFDLSLKKKERILFCINDSYWIMLYVELNSNSSDDIKIVEDTLETRYISLIGHNFRDRILTMSELSIAKGFIVFFGNNPQKQTHQVEYRITLRRNGIAIFSSYSNSSVFASDVKDALLFRAIGDVLIIDQVIFTKGDQNYSVLGLELEIRGNT